MRAINNVASRRRRKKLLKSARGFYSGRRKLFQNAKETLKRALAYAYRDRKAKKRNFRRLWITRINAACRINGMSYSRLINGLKMAGIELDRKMLSEIALNDPEAFTAIVDRARKSLEQSPEKTAARTVPSI